MKKIDMLEELSAPLTKEESDIFKELSLAYLTGKITSDQLRSCYEGTETDDQIRQRYASIKVDN